MYEEVLKEVKFGRPEQPKTGNLGVILTQWPNRLRRASVQSAASKAADTWEPQYSVRRGRGQVPEQQRES